MDMESWTCTCTWTWSHGHIAGGHIAGSRQPEPAAKVPQLRRARSPCPIASSARLQAPAPACGERVEVSWRGEGDGKGWLRARGGRRAIGGRSLHTWSGLRTSATPPARLEDQGSSADQTCETAAPSTGKSREFSGLGWWVAGVGWAHLSPAGSDRQRQRTAQPCQVSGESLPLQNERGAGLSCTCTRTHRC